MLWYSISIAKSCYYIRGGGSIDEPTKSTLLFKCYAANGCLCCSIGEGWRRSWTQLIVN
ncbi:MAG: hypothetical protein IJ371_03790 [Clostridia bacterium]|nr:hypothetical protein [Clostridia bacterium]